jgi:hypothetical protein
MTRRQAFIRGGFAGGLLVLAADAVNWFITPTAHPDAGSGQFWFAIAQVVAGVAGAAWLAHTIPGEPAAQAPEQGLREPGSALPSTGVAPPELGEGAAAPLDSRPSAPASVIDRHRASGE